MKYFSSRSYAFLIAIFSFCILTIKGASVAPRGTEFVKNILDQSFKIKKSQGEEQALQFFKDKMLKKHEQAIIHVLNVELAKNDAKKLPFLLSLAHMYQLFKYEPGLKKGLGAFFVVTGRDDSTGKRLTFFVKGDDVITSKSIETLSFKPLALAVDPTGRWVAVSSTRLPTSDGLIEIFVQNSNATLSSVSQYRVDPGPIISLAYDPSGKWLAASGPDTLRIFRQNDDGSLTEKALPRDKFGFDSSVLAYNNQGDLLGATAFLGSEIKLLSFLKNKIVTLNVQGAKVQTFTFIDEGSFGTLLAVLRRSLTSSTFQTEIGQFALYDRDGLLRLRSIGLPLVLNEAVTSLAKHPGAKSNIVAVGMRGKILLLKVELNGMLSIIREYAVPELSGDIQVRYDQLGQLLGALDTRTGDFVLFKQVGNDLQQIDRYAFGIEYAQFDFFYPRALKKTVIAKQIAETTAQQLPQELEEEVATFLTGE